MQDLPAWEPGAFGMKSDQKDDDSLPQVNSTEGVKKHLFPKLPFLALEILGNDLPHDQGTSQASDSTSYFLTFPSFLYFNLNMK